MRKLLGFLLIAGVAVLSPCCAGVTDVQSNGFTLSETMSIAAAPDKVYAALIEPARWWSSGHTFSGSAANLSLDAHAGGCFCEKLPGGGSVQHMIVIATDPGKSLRLVGMLGPFQAVAGSGVLSFTLTPDKAGTTLMMTYQIAGYANTKIRDKGYDYWSTAADAMLSDQLARLKRLIETGSPDAKP